MVKTCNAAGIGILADAVLNRESSLSLEFLKGCRTHRAERTIFLPPYRHDERCRNGNRWFKLFEIRKFDSIRLSRFKVRRADMTLFIRPITTIELSGGPLQCVFAIYWTYV